MAHPDYLREKARALRAQKGLTLDELVDRLALPKTTIYYWVRDIPLPEGRPRKPGQRKGNLAMQRKYRLLREDAYTMGGREFAELATDPCFRDFVCLYIAEGYKRSRNTASLVNSDPAVVALAHSWIGRFARNAVFCSLTHHADQDPAALTRFWSAALDVPSGSIKVWRKSNSGQLKGRTWRSQYGLLTVGTA